ncbi:MAG: (Fe-S)-binding protein [Cyanobacteria bacterium SIG30]|nr:(Fe-S)-binding protein [Cyanobacteria bacterium SIG30]
MERNHLKENLNKCSRCALCAEVCPVFDIKKSEVVLTRGKFTQLLGVLKKDLKFSKKIKKNINLCLNCGKCREFCPSDINAVKIFAQFKNDNLSFLDKILSSEFIFNLKMLPINLFKRKFDEKEGEIHFFGCVSRYKNDFVCCAMPYLTKGRLDIYNKMMNKNIKIAKNPDIKKIIFHCATCFDAFKNYDLPKNILDKLTFEPDFKIPNEKFTFHKPCHMSSEIFENIKNELKKNENFVELKENDCCGFGGDFFLKHPIISYKLAKKRAKQIESLKVKHVITSCPVCSFGLFVGKIINKIGR